MSAGWFLYDGACGVCSRGVAFWTPTLTRLSLEVVPLQSEAVRERTGMTAEQLLEDVRVLLSDDTLISGLDAYLYCMRRIWWAMPLFCLLSLPGINAAARWCYRRIAQNRLKISRACRVKPLDR